MNVENIVVILRFESGSIQDRLGQVIVPTAFCARAGTVLWTRRSSNFSKNLARSRHAITSGVIAATKSSSDSSKLILPSASLMISYRSSSYTGFMASTQPKNVRVEKTTGTGVEIDWDDGHKSVFLVPIPARRLPLCHLRRQSARRRARPWARHRRELPPRCPCTKIPSVPMKSRP